MNAATHLVCFTLDDQSFALQLNCVERVIRAVEITPLPKAPEIILGVINMQGRILPVIDLRRRFSLPARELEPDDQFIIAHTGQRTVVLCVDAVTGVIPQHAADTTATEQIASTPYVEGVLKLDDSMVLIHNLDGFLKDNEDTILDTALQPS